MDIMKRVECGSIPEPNSGCWLWQGSVYRSRRAHEYGVFSVGNKRKSVHRAAYEAGIGPIPDGLVCRHTCDVSLCVNPSHLVIGSQADNVRDMFTRGRAHQIADQSVGIRAMKAANETMRLEPDRRARGHRHGMYERPQHGESNGMSILTTEAVKEIRSLSGAISQRKIAAKFGVTQGIVWRIINRKAWCHV